MKEMQFKQIIKNTIRLLLVCVVFLFSSKSTVAQTDYYVGNTLDTIGNSDSRMIVSIEENDTIVMLHVMMMGVVKATSMELDFAYDTNALILVDNMNVPIPMGTKPTSINSILTIDSVFLKTYTTFVSGIMDHSIVLAGSATGMKYVQMGVGTSMTDLDYAFKLASNNLTPIYTIYLRKVSSGTPLQISDLGFFYHNFIPRSCSFWNYNGVYVSYGNRGGSVWAYPNPNLFVFRSPSEITTNTPTDVEDTYATLNGNLLRGKFDATNEMIVTGESSAANTGRLNYDTITQYGFIYTTNELEIISNNLSNKLIIDSVEYDFPNAAEIAAGYFERGGDTMSIVFKDNTIAKRDSNYSETVTELLDDTLYYAWAVMKYAFEYSEVYVAVGERDTFRTLRTCIPPDMPIVLSEQSFCGDATVADLIAFVADTVELRWYSEGVLLDDTVQLIDGAIYYAKSYYDCESDSVAVTVTLNNGLNAPSATSPQSFCSGAYVSDLLVSGVGIKWYDALTGGSEVLPTEELVHGTIYYAAQVDGSCESDTRTAVSVIVLDNIVVDAPVIESPQSFCDSATLNDVATDGNNIVWYDADVDGIALSASTRLEDGVTYYAAKQAGTCESTTRTAVTVSLENATINAPVVTSPQSFCERATIGNIEVPNNKIIWYATEAGNTPLDANVILLDSITYYAAQQAGDCESTERTPVLILIDVPSDAIAEENQSFCVGSIIADIAVTGAGIKWYDSPMGISELDLTTELIDGATYYAVQSSVNCESVNRVGVTVTINYVDVPTASDRQAFCDDATVADLVVFSDNEVVWYSSLNEKLDSTDLLVDGETYYARAAYEGCESDAVEVLVNIIEGLNAPTVTTPQVFCPGSLVSDLRVQEDSIVWYDAPINGSIVSPTDLLTDGFYYAAQEINNCVSTLRSEVKVIIEETILDAPTIASPQNFCDGATLADIATDGSNIVWYSALGALLPSTTALTNATTYYAAYVAGTCESEERTPVLVYTGMDGFIDAPAIASPQRFCEGATIQNIAVPNNQIIWYATATGNTEISASTILYHDVLYYAAQRVGECESTERTPVRILFDNPQGPDAVSPQVFCGVDYTLADLEIIGGGIVWYDAMTDGNKLSSSTVLTTTPTWYYAAQGAANCESSRIGIFAYVNELPQTPVISDELIICANEETMDLTSVVETELGITYTYYSDNGITVIANPENVIVPAQDMKYYVKATNTLTGCESELLGEIDVTISPLPVVSVLPVGAYAAVNGTVVVTITDNNTNSAVDAKTATIVDGNIATIELVNGELTVVGIARGNTEVIYTSVNENGCSTEVIIPVQIEGLPTGILTGKDIVVCGTDTTAIVQIAYVMGGIAPWTITVSDDKGTFSKDTVINSIEGFPVDMEVVIPANTSGVPEYTTYVISNVEDALGSSKQTHYGAVRIGVNPIPEINNIANKHQIVCDGESTLPISFDGIATVYKWSVDSNIGIANYSDGVISSFVAVNETENPITATILVTPEYWYNGVVCIGETDTATITVNPTPKANFVYNVAGLGSVQFTDKSSSNIVEWSWNFGDDSTSALQNPEHTYLTSGIYTVTLTVKYASGCEASISKDVKVNVSTNLSADFIVNTQVQCLEGNEFLFTDKTTITTEGHSVSNWLWNFGDGNTSTDRNPNHTYDTAGTYTVTLIVTEKPGNSKDSVKFTVNVIGLPTIIDGTAPAICEGEKLQVSLPTISWNGNAPVAGQWILDGKLFDINTTPLTSADNGKTLQYRVETSCGVAISTGLTISIYSAPKITLDNSVIELCEAVETVEIPFTLTDTVSGVVLYYSISFNDEARRAGFRDVTGESLTGNTIEVIVPAGLTGGYYGGIITIEANNGCQTTSSAAFDIYKSESIRITKQPQSAIVCETHTVTLSVEANSTNVNYQWYYNGVAISGANYADYTFVYHPGLSGEYYAEVSNSCMTLTSNTVDVGENLLTIQMKWDNLIYVNNPANAFVSFQWYKDGLPIMTDGYGPYYSDESGFDGAYHVKCYYADGSYMETCPVTLNTKKSTKVLLYPSPAEAGSRVVIEIHTTEHDITNAALEIFDAAGKLVSRGLITGTITEVTAPMAAGIYTARIITKSEHVFYERFVVGQ